MYSEITYDNIREVRFVYCPGNAVSEPSFELCITDDTYHKAVLEFTPEAYQELQTEMATAIQLYNER